MVYPVLGACSHRVMGMGHGNGRSCFGCGALLGVVLGVAGPAKAVTIVVNSAGPAGPAECNLEQAIAAANSDVAGGGCAAGNGADSIVFADALGDLELANALHVRRA